MTQLNATFEEQLGEFSLNIFTVVWYFNLV
jgi:hypothetical protein